VFTPTGDVKELPGGATVLNFALSIHNDLAAHCAGGIVNGQTRVGPLDVLSDGDRVEVLRSPDLVPLPLGWRDRVPPSSVHDVVRRLSRLHEAADVEAGRRAVRHHAARFDLDGLDAASIDHAVQRTVQARDWGGRGDALSVRQWLRRLAPQTGLKAEDRADLPLDAELRDRLLNQVCSILRESVVDVTLELPPELAEHSVDDCPHCNSGAGDRRAIEVREGRVIVHESTKVSCAQGDVIPLAPRYQRRLRHWIVAETHSRQGVAGDLMEVFKNKGIDIQEVVARHTSLGRGLFRTEIRPIDRESEDALLVDLRTVGGVLDVYAVGEHQQEQLSSELPPPRGRPTRAHGTAYVVGPPVCSDHHFYGRDGLIGDLLAALRPDSRAATGRGIYVFGPLRAGKTSLVLRVQHLLRRQDPMAVVTHLAANLPVNDYAGEHWEHFEPRLRSQLADDLARWAEGAGGTLWPHADSPGVAGLVESVLEAADADRLPRIVLMIDEAVGLMAATEKLGGWADFLASIDRLRAQGVRLIWVGPPARVCAGQTSGYVDFLKPCMQLRVGPFQTADEVRDVLMARLADPYPPRTLGWKQARKVLELTGGEPGWVQALGRALEATAPARSSLIFDGPAVKRAVGQLVRDDLLFYPRTAHAGTFSNWYGDVSGRDAWSALRAMARWRAQRPGVAVPLAALIEALGQPAEAVLDVMQALEEMGAVTTSVESAHAWTFVAALLELYVGRHAGVTHVH
ncbi:MAG: TGS domain-containing protein, partial [Myxococcales bacterium]|nr:TGS domain-containing protein [Myxococcales bacterium]